MKRTNTLTAIMMAMVLLLLLPAAASAKEKQAKPAPHQAKVSLADARKTALARVPGTVEHEELEKEHGRWIYSFEIKPDGEQDPKVIKEVNVDADTGEIVAVETEHDGK